MRWEAWSPFPERENLRAKVAHWVDTNVDWATGAFTMPAVSKNPVVINAFADATQLSTAPEVGSALASPAGPAIVDLRSPEQASSRYVCHLDGTCASLIVLISDESDTSTVDEERYFIFASRCFHSLIHIAATSRMRSCTPSSMTTMTITWRHLLGARIGLSLTFCRLAGRHSARPGCLIVHRERPLA